MWECSQSEPSLRLGSASPSPSASLLPAGERERERERDPVSASVSERERACERAQLALTLVHPSGCLWCLDRARVTVTDRDDSAHAHTIEDNRRSATLNRRYQH